MTALPDEVPVQFVSEIDVTVYVVLEAGLTERTSGLEATLSEKPSDHITDQGPVPVRTAWIDVESPGQIAAEPLTVAVGSGLTTNAALPEDVPVKWTSETAVTV